MKNKFPPPIVLLFIVCIFFAPFLIQGKLPIPSDTLIGLYHPYRDLYEKEFPRGLPFKNFLITDPIRQQYPWKTLAIEKEKAGKLPLWNPYTFAGTPLLANFQSAAFYPINILFFLMPFSLAWSLLIMVQPVLAAIFLYCYLRHLKITQPASFLGGIVFAFCGFSTAWLQWGTIIQTALWLPLILFSIDNVLQRFIVKESAHVSWINKYWVWELLLVFSLTSALFAGHLQTFIYLFLVSIAYLICRWIQFGKQRKSLNLVFLLLIIFAIITVVQWYPTLQFILQSARSVDQLNNWQQPGWFIPWQNLIQFIEPDFFGNPTTLNYWGVWNYGEFIGYVGILPLLFAFFAMYNRRDKKTLFFGSIFFLSLIFSLPNILAQLPYIWQIPFLSTTQPTRLLFLTDFSLAVLASLGFDLYLKTEKKITILYAFGIITTIFAGLWFFILFGNNSFGVSPEHLAVAKRNLVFPSLIYGAVCILFIIHFLLRRKKSNVITSGLIILVLVITVVDLYRFSQKFNPFTVEKYLYPTTKTLSFLQAQKGQFRIMTTASEILPPNVSSMYHLQSVDGYDPLYLLRYGELMASMGRNKPDISSPFGFNRIITPHNIDNRLVDILGIKYVLSLSEINNPAYKKVSQEGQTLVYENANVYPRTFFVNTIKSASSKEEAIKLLFDNNINLHTTAIVENWDQKQNTFGNGSANTVEYNENKVVEKTKNEKESYLILMDTFYPTWHAKICSLSRSDCKETKIYRTNYNFRGIVVPGGEHIVTFEISLL